MSISLRLSASIAIVCLGLVPFDRALAQDREGHQPEAARPEANPSLGFVPLFDGKTLAGWEGSREMFRVEDGAIVGGNLRKSIPRNEFLTTTKQFSDFDLRLQFKLLGEKANAGVQFRTRRIPDDHEVIGYQADLGDPWWGCLYDESRRKVVLAGPEEEKRSLPIRRNQWNDYRILCQGKRIQLWINDTQTVDYTELDHDIPQRGIIALQVHSGPPMEVWYRKIRIKDLRKTSQATSFGNNLPK